MKLFVTLIVFICCFAVLSITAAGQIDVSIGPVSNAGVGRQVNVPITVTSDAPGIPLGGFDLLIHIDPSVFYQSISPGALLVQCDWEYFSVNPGPLSTRRVVALADINNGAQHPDCYGEAGGQIAIIHLMIPNDSSLMGQLIPIRWYWTECGDNAISSPNGQTLYVSDEVYAFDGSAYTAISQDTILPTEFGAPDDCLESDTADIIRYIDYYNGGIALGIVDTIPPTAVCPGDMVVQNPGESCGTTVTWQATASDNNPDPVVYCNPPSGTFFDIGEHNVECIAIDTAGNVDTCTFTVTVVDTTRPVIFCPGDYHLYNDPGTCGALVEFNLQATDNCPGVTLFTQPQAGSFFPVGSTQVVVIATDASGNYRGCLFDVIIEDTTAPELICPENIVMSNDSGQCGASVSFNAEFSDNCSEVSVTFTPASGSYFEVGEHVVGVVAEDAYGNADSCLFTVKIVDSESPRLGCPPPIEVLSDSGSYGAIVTYEAGVADNCGASVQYFPASGSLLPVGTTLVVAYAVDNALNADTCAFAVTVVLDDPDQDGRPSWNDNCPMDSNPSQSDTDGDGLGDACCCIGPSVGNLDRSPDHLVTMSDLTILMDHLFGSLEPMGCPESGNLDQDSSGGTSLSDLTVMIDHLFVTLTPLPQCP